MCIRDRRLPEKFKQGDLSLFALFVTNANPRLIYQIETHILVHYATSPFFRDVYKRQRVRGTLFITYQLVDVAGIIPACAGNTNLAF